MENESIKFPDPNLSVNLKKLNITKDQEIRWFHLHNEIEIIKVNRGEILCFIDDKEIKLSEGDTFLIGKKVVHRLSFFKNNAEVSYIQIDTDRYSEMLIPYTDYYLCTFINGEGIEKYKKFDASSEISIIFDGIKKELTEKQNSYENFIKAHIFHIIALMCRHKFFPDYSVMQSRKQIAKILPALRYAEENFMNEIIPEDACALINTDKYYFCKLFKKAVGGTFTEYVNFLRMYHAEKMLIDCDKNISEIAYECGFTSIQYFNRLFKKQKGITPTEYRKLNIT